MAKRKAPVEYEAPWHARSGRHWAIQAGPGFTVFIVETADGRFWQYSYQFKKWLAYPPLPTEENPELIS